MLAFWIILLIRVAAQAPPAPCALAGPPVEAHWSGAIPPASTAKAPLRAVTDVPLPGSAPKALWLNAFAHPERDKRIAVGIVTLTALIAAT